MNINFHKDFLKDYWKLNIKQRTKVDHILTIFKTDPFRQTLKNHPLKSALFGKRAISAGGDLRIIFKEHNNYLEVLCLRVGTHNQVY